MRILMILVVVLSIALPVSDSYAGRAPAGEKGGIDKGSDKDVKKAVQE